MENLDDFMRRKFNTDPEASGERFEFREEYWEQAQALLEAEEAKRRKRRRWLLWWFFVGVAGVAIGWWQWPASVEAVAGENSRQEQLAGKSGGDRNGDKDAQASPGHESGQGLGASSVGSSSETGSVQAKGGDAARGFVSGEKTPVADSIFLKKNIENQKIGTQKGRAKNGSAPKQQTKKDRNELTPVSSPQQREGLGQASTSTVPPSQNPAAGSSNTPGQPDPTQQNPTLAQAAPTDSLAAPNDLNDFRDVLALPTLLTFLEQPVRDLDTPFFAPFVRPIKPLRERRFGFGLAAAGTLSSASPDGKRLGGTGGVFAMYRLAPAWSMTGGASWRFVPGDWGGADSTGTETSTRLRYSFGYQREEQILETHGLHFAELSLGLQWRRGPFGAEAGIAPGFLLAVQGRQVQRSSASLQSEASSSSSRVWLDKAPYRSAHLAVFLGAEWRMNRWLGLELRGTYRPGSLLKPVSDAALPGNLFWLDAGLRWHF